MPGLPPPRRPNIRARSSETLNWQLGFGNVLIFVDHARLLGGFAIVDLFEKKKILRGQIFCRERECWRESLEDGGGGVVTSVVGVRDDVMRRARGINGQRSTGSGRWEVAAGGEFEMGGRGDRIGSAKLNVWGCEICGVEEGGD